ncbi:MAG: hypothetical protein ACPGSK_05995 [Alphaproteobacteria bacterium]
MMQSKVEIDEAQQDTDVEQSIRQVANDLHRLNQSITKAVEAGATVELLRGSRYHCGTGRWGDQMVPVVRVPETN